MVAFGALPLLLTLRRMRKGQVIMRRGITATAVVMQVTTQRYYKGGMLDNLKLEYKTLLTGQTYFGQATAIHGKFKPGDSLPLTYLSNDPLKFTIDGGKSYWPMLVFSILLWLFVCFAAYKINEMIGLEYSDYNLIEKNELQTNYG